MTFDPKKDKIFADLMHEAQKGDKKAYCDLLTAISPILHGFICNKVGSRYENDDILQEILIGIHKSSHTYNNDRSFVAWMFAIANYKVQDFLRSHYRKNSLTQVDFDKVKDFLPDNVTKQGVQNELLDEAMGKLPQKQQKILYLMRIEGYSAKETAKIMKMSVSAVKVSAHRSYKKLTKISQAA